jgi:hypothetical protein
MPGTDAKRPVEKNHALDAQTIESVEAGRATGAGGARL